MTIVWAALAFLCGSLMGSYWLGLVARHNLREVGDGNPGAANLWKIAGPAYGLSGVAFDFLKGYVPVLWLKEAGAAQDYGLALVALAAVMGHAFSPWLRWQGGKAIAVTFGVWSALTGFAASLAYAVILALLLLAAWALNRGKAPSRESNAFQVVFGQLILLVFLLSRGYGPAIVTFWAGNLILLSYTHRRELALLFGRVSAKG